MFHHSRSAQIGVSAAHKKNLWDSDQSICRTQRNRPIKTVDRKTTVLVLISTLFHFQFLYAFKPWYINSAFSVRILVLLVNPHRNMLMIRSICMRWIRRFPICACIHTPCVFTGLYYFFPIDHYKSEIFLKGTKTNTYTILSINSTTFLSVCVQYDPLQSSPKQLTNLSNKAIAFDCLTDS